LIENIEDFGKAIAKQNISQTFTMTDKNLEQPEKITEMLIKEVILEKNEITDL